MRTCAFILLLAAAQSAGGAPFLVCDPVAEDISSYVVDIDGVEYSDQVPEVVAGKARLRMDLAPLALAAGKHTAKAKACNAAGCSAWSAVYSGVMSPPFAPSGLRVAP